MAELPVGIVGGGLAGLVAARELKRAGVPVRLFEASPQLGGLARSSKDERGFSFDFGAHFITNRLASELGAAHLCRPVRYYGESVNVGGEVYSYPFGFVRNPAYLASFLRAKVASGGAEPSDAAAQLAAMYGERMSRDIAVPLVEGWSKTPADQLSPAVVEKLDEGVAKTVWLKMAGRATRRAVTIGYTREKPSSARVWHVYPEGGLGTLIAHLAEETGDVIEVESPVQAIVVEGGRARALRVKDELVDVSAVMSTAPVNILGKLVEGTDALAPMTRFRYRPMVFVNLFLEGRGLMPNVVTWFTDPTLPFFRLTETPLSMPWLAPEGKTTLMADLAADVGDEVWSADDDHLADLTVKAIEATVPDIADRMIGSRVMRTPIAYPLFLNEYEEDRRRFARGTGVDGLYSIGRNGEFAHILMEDVYWRTRKRTAELMGYLRS